MYESKLAAENIATFNASDIGLPSSTSRCRLINLVSGETGYIECVIRGAPPIHGDVLRINRNASGQWQCQTAAGTLDRYKPSHCN